MMIYKNTIHTILLILFVFATLTACTDDDIQIDDNEIPTDITNGYSLTLAVSLEDGIGGTDDNPMREIENYVDPEKLRVLFFDNQDNFLFESKSRWVKQILPEESEGLSRWFVSVPVFSYGNDTGEYEWNWTKIREALTTNRFKIAILANRSDTEWNMGISGKNDTDYTIVKGGWFDNSGPNWTKDNAVGGNDVKKIMDLHHCQYDPIYDGKNWDNNEKTKDGETYYENYEVYNFISETYTDEEGKMRPKMGATSSWVSWGNQDDDTKSIGGRNTRHWIHPSKDKPIPMYGIQEFERIDANDWKEGTTFNLTRTGDKPISLLRSVVKVELLIPVNINPELILVWYPNIYARCEPLDIWTPTDQIWEAAGEHTYNDKCKEWKSIQKHGPVAYAINSTTGNNNDATEIISRREYQKRMSWYYGIWSQHGWEKLADFSYDESEYYPQIFNTCIQRNTYVECADNIKYSDGKYNHWIVYMGERNVNDPSNLLDISKDSSGYPTIIYWMININGILYNIPFVDYRDGRAAEVVITTTADKIDNKINDYEKEVMAAVKQDGTIDENVVIPLPLLRNHLYRFIIDGFNTWDFTNGFSVRTNTDLAADSKWGTDNSTDYTYTGYKDLSSSVVTTKPVQANNHIIKELVGITFESTGLSSSGGNISLRSNGLRISKQNMVFNLPEVEIGDKIKILYKSANNTQKRGIKSNNSNIVLFEGQEEVDNTNTEPTVWEAKAKTTPKFQVSTGGIDVLKIEIIKNGTENGTSNASRRANKSSKGGITIKSENHYSKSLTSN